MNKKKIRIWLPHNDFGIESAAWSPFCFFSKDQNKKLKNDAWVELTCIKERKENLEPFRWDLILRIKYETFCFSHL